MRNRYMDCWLAAGMLAMAACCPGAAQTITGSVNGTVTDTTGAAVPNATVTATNTATGVQTTGQTSGAGDYTIRFLQIGQYTVTIKQQGFKETTIGPFTLEVNQTAKVDAKLTVGESSQTVTVTNSLQPILDTDNATISSTFTANTIQNIPLNGRNFSSLTMFIPGAVSTDPTGMSNTNAIERNTLSQGQVSVNGNRNQTNNYLLDGIEINETINNLIGYNPSPDAIQNLTVVTSNAGAEYGNVNGGDVVAVLKSGSNQFHGSAFGFLENAKLDAAKWEDKYKGVGKNPYTQTVFGGTIGGPIMKNKLFFFLDYEGARYNLGGTDTASVIPGNFRQGDFSQLGFPLYHYVNGAGFVPWANNVVPVTNPAAQFLFAHPELYPLPNQAGTGAYGIQNNYRGANKKFVRNDQGDVKVDYTIGAHDTIMGRYSQGSALDGIPAVPLLITFPGSNQYPFKGIATNWIHTFSPSVVNELRAGYSRIRWINGTPADLTGQFGLTGNQKVGINALQTYAGFSNINFTGANTSYTTTTPYLSNLGTSALVLNFIDNTFDYSDNLTIQAGKHVMKTGVEVLRYQQNNFYPGNDGTMGQFLYSGAYSSNPNVASASGYGVADFLQDNVYFSGVGGITGRTGQRQYRDAAFFQDDWKVMPNLTLNLGLRYEYDQPIYEVNNKQANVDLDTGAVYNAGQAGASAVFGDGRALYKPVYTNLMPRIGFSYQPKERIVIRGGYGITNYLEGTGANLRLTFNPPFQYSFEQANNVPTATSGGASTNLQTGFPNAAGNANFGSNTYRAWDKNLRPAFIQEFSLSSEYQLDNSTSVVVGYVGQTGQHLIDPRAGNQLTAPGTTAPYAALVGQNGNVVVTEAEAMMNYNAAQLQVRHRQSHGLEYTVNYTFAKTLTNNPGFFGVSGVSGASAYWQNAYDGSADYGPSGADVRHNLSATGVYQLPFGRGQRYGANMNRVLNEAAGGWKLTGTAIAYSGFPVTIAAPNTTNLNNRASRADHFRPLKIRDRSLNNWFGTDPSAAPCSTYAEGVSGSCAYGQAAPGEFGTASVNSERAPGFNQVDLSAAKAFAITEAQNVEFRADFFNAFNIASYSNPDNDVTSESFGLISNVRSPQRQIQFSLHYSF